MYMYTLVKLNKKENPRKMGMNQTIPYTHDLSNS